MKNKPRLFHLSFAFPPGLRALHPGINPAGNAFETQMIAALGEHLEIRSAGLLPFPIEEIPAGADPASGVAHQLLLVEQPPELWNRWKALRQLQQTYQRWLAEGWRPDAVMIYNLTPVYNQFIRWVRRQPDRPKLVLLLLDSSQLGEKWSAWKRFRYRLKPFTTLDDEMLKEFDACIGLSAETKKYATANDLPFLWMPGACTPSRAPKPIENGNFSGPVRFCYFGSLAPHAGALGMTKLFLQTPGNSELHICGYGKQRAEFEQLARQSSRLKFHGLLPKPEDCLTLGQSCDVLINPRPPGHGNDNNVASKLFDYALCGRAILASRISGNDDILGPEAFYFEPNDYENSLRAELERCAKTPREELRRRGAVIKQRIMSEFNWQHQAARMAEFIQHC